MTTRFSPTRRTVLGLGAGLLAAPALIRPAYANTAVSIQNFAFAPASITVAVGDTVTFTNSDSAPHTATARNGAFDTGNLNNGQSAQVQMTQAGTFEYFCRIHPNMQGTITVG